MSTIAAKLKNIIKCKNAIRTAINNKGGHVTENSEFSDYVAAINNLTSNEGSVDIMKPVYTTQKAPVTKVDRLEKIFFDTSLTTEQVDSIIANANLEFSVIIDDDGVDRHFYQILTTQQIMIIIVDYSPNLNLESGSAWAIGDPLSGAAYYWSSIVAESYAKIFLNTPPAGWNKDAFTNYDTGEVNFGTDLAQEEGGFNVGAQNNLITDLVYIPALVDSGEVELAKNLTGHYKLIEKDITLDAEIDTDYTYGFENSVDEDTKEISIIRNIKVINDKESSIIDKTIATYTNNKIKKIGPYAFASCQSLTDADFPNVRDIGDHAFYECSNLVNINIPLAPVINSYTFSNCGSLVNIDIPQVTSIGEKAFYYCDSLTNISLPQVTSISSYAFHYCSSLISISLPQLTSISEWAFYECGSLTDINFPQVTSIGDRAFCDCDSLTDINLPLVTSIGEGTFFNCYSLVDVSLPQVTSIPRIAFYGCSSLTNIDIPFPLVTSIGDEAFYRCYSLVDISLPQVTNISRGTFYYCESLINVSLPQVKSIGANAFYHCDSLINISLPLVTSIGADAFYYCGSLKSITAPLVEELKSYAFYGCGLESCSFPNLLGIRDKCFYNNYNLRELDLPNIKYIGSYAFSNCYSLIKVFIGNACVLNSTNAFDKCYHILGTTDSTYNPEGLKDGYIYVPASLLANYKGSWGNLIATQIIGHENFEAGATLPNYTNSNFTKQTWYSDEKLTTVVTSVATSGTYYCRLEN